MEPPVANIAVPHWVVAHFSPTNVLGPVCELRHGGGDTVYPIATRCAARVQRRIFCRAVPHERFVAAIDLLVRGRGRVVVLGGSIRTGFA